MKPASIYLVLPFIALCSVLPGCATAPMTVPLLPQSDPAVEESYVIESGDVLAIKFYYAQDLSDVVTVRPDGMISLQLVDDVQAAGLTPQELDDQLTDLYRDQLPDRPDVSVIVQESAGRRVYITGEVEKPGELPLRSKMSLFQAISAAGGFKDTANKNTVLVIRQDQNGTPSVFRANLSTFNVASAEATSHVLLQPRDTVYVVKSGIAEANLAVDQYVRKLLLFNGLSIGAQAIYDINGNDNNF